MRESSEVDERKKRHGDQDPSSITQIIIDINISVQNMRI